MSEWVRRWARFFEIRVYDSALPVLVGVAMAWQPPGSVDFWTMAALLFAFFLLHVLFVHGSDAIAGYMRGVDQVVYRRRGVVKHPKLLVTGEVTLSQAIIMTSAVALMALSLLAYFAFTTNTLVFAIMVVFGLIGAQYSVGLSFSYRGMGEVIVSTCGLGTPVAFMALTDRVELGPFLIGAMLGLFAAGVNMNSNQADYAYDREAGRNTLAVLMGKREHRNLTLVVFALCWLCFAAALATGAIPLYGAVVFVLLRRHIRQLRLLFAGDPIEARKVGFIANRILTALLLLVITTGKIWG